MLNTAEFGNLLKKYKFDFFSGVPCSFLTNLINYSINELNYIGAANEGDAVAISAGAYLGGNKSCVLFQNSGLGNAVSPLTSLIHTFKIPILGFVTLRGEPGVKDEPQHKLMGTITEKMLTLMDIEWDYLSQDIEKVDAQLAYADACFEKRKAFFFVVKKNTFDSVSLLEQPNKPYLKNTVLDSQQTNTFPSRLSVLECISQLKTEKSIVLATTGKTGRELCCGVDDSRQHLYMVGSMGCISSLSLGLSLVKKDHECFTIDGDGAFLMRMGNIATIGSSNVNNLCHIILDNNTHDSTGGQKTVSDSLDIPGMLHASGYDIVYTAYSLNELKDAVHLFRKKKKLTGIYLKIAPGSTPDIGRPEIMPHEVKSRLMDFLNA